MRQISTAIVSALWVSLLLSASLQAKTLQWQEVTVVAVSSDSSNMGVAVMPVGSAVYGIPIRRTFMYYRVETDAMTYVIAQRCESSLRAKYKCPLDITIHGKTKIAIDGRNVHVLDDAGKDVELQLFAKILKTQPSPTETPTKK